MPTPIPVAMLSKTSGELLQHDADHQTGAIRSHGATPGHGSLAAPGRLDRQTGLLALFVDCFLEQGGSRTVKNSPAWSLATATSPRCAPTTAATTPGRSPVLPAARERDESLRGRTVEHLALQPSPGCAGAVVSDREHRHRVAGGQPRGHRRARRRVGPGVGQQVRYLVQPQASSPPTRIASVGKDASGGPARRRARSTARRSPWRSGRRRRRPAGGRRVQAGQQQEVLDQAGHPGASTFDPADRMGHVVRDCPGCAGSAR